MIYKNKGFYSHFMDVPYSEAIWRKKFYPTPNLDYKSLRLSDVGFYSITKPVFIDKILSIIRHKFKNEHIKVTDATAGMGMISIILAKKYKVNAVELLPNHVDIIRNNAAVYGVSKNLSLINSTYLDVMYDIKQDVVILDPPWDQADGYYAHKPLLDLYLGKVDVTTVIKNLITNKKVKMVILFCPNNYNISGFVEKVPTKTLKIYKVRGEKHYILVTQS